MFERDHYLKLVDTQGNYRFGFITEIKDKGYMLVIDLNEEGLSKIEWDNEYAANQGKDVLVRNFDELLTPTEKKLITLLAYETNTNAIASDMKITPTTVRAHIRELKIKLQVSTREQLFAYAQGIVKKLKDGN